MNVTIFEIITMTSKMMRTAMGHCYSLYFALNLVKREISRNLFLVDLRLLSARTDN